MKAAPAGRWSAVSARLALVVGLAAGACAAAAEDLRAPVLGASTSFAQSWYPRILEGSRQIPLTVFRDEIWWRNVETPDGDFVFDTPRTLYPEKLPALGAELMFLVNNPHPAHDGGNTPRTDAALRAFADYTVETLRRFPDIRIVEVGNEMNSSTFAVGPGWEGDIATRAASYARLLAETAAAVRAERPEARIIGGAAHSIPIAWFEAVFAHGAADHMDALAIHPYTVAPEQLQRQVRLLRHRVPQAADLPLAVTEFGQTDAATAPSYLLRHYCQQALADTAWSVWYPLNPRGDGLAALLTSEGALTDLGRTFRHVRQHFEGRAVTDIAPDPFTYGCRFGPDRMVLWGEPRRVRLDPGVRVEDPVTGLSQTVAETVLSPDRPLVLVSDTGRIGLGQEVRLGPHGLVADSFHQFAYPGGPDAGRDPFTRLLRQNGREWPLETFPGQERGGVPWTPYLGTDLDGVARAAADYVLPSSPPAGPIAIVHRYAAPAGQRLDVELRLDPWEAGVALAVTLDGAMLHEAEIVARTTVTLPALDVPAGAVLDVVARPRRAGPGGARLRILLHEAAP